MKALQIVLFIAILGLIGFIVYKETSESGLVERDYQAIQYGGEQLEKLVLDTDHLVQNRYKIIENAIRDCGNSPTMFEMLNQAEIIRMVSLEATTNTNNAFYTLNEKTNASAPVDLAFIELNNHLSAYAEKLSTMFPPGNMLPAFPIQTSSGKTVELSELKDSSLAIWKAAKALIHGFHFRMEDQTMAWYNQKVDCKLTSNKIGVALLPQSTTIQNGGTYEADAYLSGDYYFPNIMIDTQDGEVKKVSRTTMEIIIPTKDIALDDNGEAQVTWKALVKIPTMQELIGIEVERTFTVKAK